METTNSWVDFTITRGPIRGGNRNKIGLLIHVKTRKEIEEFMSGMSQGRQMPIDAHGDGWYNIGEGPLEYYESETRLDGQRIYTLDSLGGPPLINQNEQRLLRGGVPDELVNLAFLRLVGISSENGVTIGLSGAYSNEYLRRFRGQLPTAAKQFLQDYIVPITINLQVISRG